MVILFYFMHQLVPGAQRDLENELHRERVAFDWDSRRERVREAFLYSWRGYVDHAWGKDEYKPISGSGRNMIPEGKYRIVQLRLI